MLHPLVQRIRLGEGGLLGMALWAAAWETRDAATVAAVAVLTLVVLAALYLYNDVVDRDIDALNPKKDAVQRQALLERPRFYLAVALGTQVAAVFVAAAVLGTVAAAGALSLLLLNPFYSRFAKRIPALDVFIVGTMGAAVVALAIPSPSLLFLAGAMTAISHAFQTRVDRTADLAAGIQSSGTAPTPVRNVIWVVLMAILAVAVYPRLGIAGSLSTLLPYVILSRSTDPNRGWAWARVYFAVLWITATVR